MLLVLMPLNESIQYTFHCRNIFFLLVYRCGVCETIVSNVDWMKQFRFQAVFTLARPLKSLRTHTTIFKQKGFTESYTPTNALYIQLNISLKCSY